MRDAARAPGRAIRVFWGSLLVREELAEVVVVVREFWANEDLWSGRVG